LGSELRRRKDVILDGGKELSGQPHLKALFTLVREENARKGKGGRGGSVLRERLSERRGRPTAREGAEPPNSLGIRKVVRTKQR